MRRLCVALLVVVVLFGAGCQSGGGRARGTLRMVRFLRVPLTRRATRVDLSSQAGRGKYRGL